MSQPHPPHPPDEPFTGPSKWFNYRCRSCEHSGWVEDIVVWAFPPNGPGGCPMLICPECEGEWGRDTSKEPELSMETPGRTDKGEKPESGELS